jgi:pimeloyl-ACP methyl ester carboxylesterase
VSAPVELHVAVDEGQGEPLVLLHGWPQDSTMWKRVIPGLSERFRCIALDLRGLGRSPAPPEGYDKEQFAQDVLHTLDGMGIERFRVLGHDWGAVTAQLLCVAAPDRVVKAMVLDVPSMWNESKDPRQALGLLHMPILASPLGTRVGPALAEQILRASRVPADDVAHYKAMLSEPARRVATHLIYKTALLHDMPKMLRDRPPKPDVPMLFLGGRGDPVIRWGSDFELVEGSSHFLPDNNPELVVERALAFF